MKKTIIIIALVLLAGIVLLATRWVFPARPRSTFDRKSVSLEVFNGCGVPGIARAVADEMLRRGFDVYDTGNCDSVQDQTTVIDLLDPDAVGARAVADELAVERRRGPFRRERLTPAWRAALDSSRYVSLRLVAGRDHETYFPGLFILK